MQTNSGAADGSAEPAVLVARDDQEPAVAVVTLNRPERRNALTGPVERHNRDGRLLVVARHEDGGFPGSVGGTTIGLHGAMLT